MTSKPSQLTIEKITESFDLLGIKTPVFRIAPSSHVPYNDKEEDGRYKIFTLLTPGSVYSSPNACNDRAE